MRSVTVPLVGCSLVLFLSACTGGFTPVIPPAMEEASSSSVSPTEVTYVGLLGSSVIGIYMEGTHRLQTAAGTDILLRSDSVDLDSHLGKTVAVTGIARSTVEEGGIIMDVRVVEDMQPQPIPEPPLEPLATSSSAAASSVEVIALSSSSVARAASSPSAAESSSVMLLAASSSSSESSSEAPAQAPLDERAAKMANAQVDAGTFTQVFCSSHVSFCIPLHKSWYYNSFGATSSTLWHVEVSSQSVEKLGDGPLIVNLVSGTLDSSIPDESVVRQGDFIIGYRAWTNNRHFEITAPSALYDAVAYMVSALSVYQVDAASSSSVTVSSLVSSQ